MCGAIFDLTDLSDNVPGFACLYSFSFIHSWPIHSFRKFRLDKVGNYMVSSNKLFN